MKEFNLPIVCRNRNFLLLWLGQILSQAGIRMYQIAILWWILTACKGGGKEIGLFLVMGALPSILFVKLSGKTIDKTRSKPILIICDVLAFSVVGLVFLGLTNTMLTLMLVYVAGFAIATLDAFFTPTLNKAIGELVELKDIEGAVAFQTSTQSLAYFGGAVAGAILIDRIGITYVVLINAATYLLSACCNLCIRFKPKDYSRGATEAIGVSGWKILEDLPLIKRVLIGFGLVNFFATPTLVVLPLYTNKTLHEGASVLGYLEAGLWIGLLCGSFSTKLFEFIKSTIKLGALCLFIFGLCIGLPGIIVAKNFYVCMLFIAGFALGVNNVKFVSLFQQVIRPEIKGRFFALMQALISFTFPVAYFLFGVLADLTNPPYLCIIQGAGVICLSLYFLSLVKEDYRTQQLP